MVAETKFVWMEGKFVKWHDANVHILTHALHYGSSVFEGVHSYKADAGTALFRLNEHIDRFFHSANALSMKIKFTKNELVNAIKELAKKNRLEDGYVRPLAYYGYGPVGIFPRDIKTNVALITVPWEDYYSKDLRIMTSKYIRHSAKSTVLGAKIGGNYANSILAMHEARKKGYDEALMLDEEGCVSEGPAENIFIVKKGVLRTPDSKSALHGITRNSILKISRDFGIKAYEAKISLSNVKNADEVFFSGTATEIAPVIEVDGKRIRDGKPGKITSRLKAKFYEIVRGKDKKYKSWLTYIC
ncbi:branched-chain amino acid transaminase [Candidatus Woesearchaeota archaeon]|nr:branched-chain amino acid transaminase [Candidatus Woesearchaeota archaeon]